ncbi:hypothetical protein E4T56_gene8609, partial [Termitomyces sp. T112]
MRMGIDQAGQQHRPMPVGGEIQFRRARIALAQQLDHPAFTVDHQTIEPLDIAQRIERQAGNMIDQPNPRPARQNGMSSNPSFGQAAKDGAGVLTPAAHGLNIGVKLVDHRRDGEGQAKAASFIQRQPQILAHPVNGKTEIELFLRHRVPAIVHLPAFRRAAADCFEHLVQIEMFGLRQTDRFGQSRRHAGQCDLVDHLGRLSGARFADMHDAPRIGAHHGCGGGHRIGPSAAHQRQRARLGARLRAGHGRIDAADFLVACLNRDLAGDAGGNRGMVDEQPPRMQRGEHALRPQHHLKPLRRGPDQPARTQGLERGLIHPDLPGDDQPQPRGAGAHLDQIARPAQRRDKGRASVLLARAIGRGNAIFLTPRRFQIQPDDGKAEHRIIDREIGQPHRDQHQRPRRLGKVQHIVEQPRRKAEAQMDMEQGHQRHRRPGQHRMQSKKRGRQKHEAELDRLGHAGQKGGCSKAGQHAARLAPFFRPRAAIHGKAGGGQAEHHHREKAAHESARAGIAGEEPPQIARHPMIIAQHEPCDIVQNMVQPGHQQQAIEQAIGKQAQLAAAQRRARGAADARIDRIMAEPHQRGQQYAACPRDDRHKALAAEKGEEIGRPEAGKAIIAKPADHARDNPQRYGHTADLPLTPCAFERAACGFGHARHHIGGHFQQRLGAFAGPQKAYDPGHRRRAIAIAGKAGRHAHGKQQAPIGEHRPARRPDARP